MQYKPKLSSDMSRRHMGQFKGSFAESVGCGSRRIFPSAVRFIWAGAGGLEDDREDGYGDGMEEADVLAGWCLRPSGSLRFEARSKTVPVYGISS
jgi:hypothetical protein